MPGGLRVGGAPGARVGLVLAGGSRVNEQTPVGGPVDADSGYGTVLVRNDSDFENCVVIGGDSQGRVWKGSSEDCDVALGSHKVEAWVGDEVAPPRQAPDSGGMR